MKRFRTTLHYVDGWNRRPNRLLAGLHSGTNPLQEALSQNTLSREPKRLENMKAGEPRKTDTGEASDSKRGKTLVCNVLPR